MLVALPLVVPGVAMIWFVRNHLARGFTLRA